MPVEVAPIVTVGVYFRAPAPGGCSEGRVAVGVAVAAVVVVVTVLELNGESLTSLPLRRANWAVAPAGAGAGVMGGAAEGVTADFVATCKDKRHVKNVDLMSCKEPSFDHTGPFNVFFPLLPCKCHDNGSIIFHCKSSFKKPLPLRITIFQGWRVPKTPLVHQTNIGIMSIMVLAKFPCLLV